MGLATVIALVTGSPRYRIPPIFGIFYLASFALERFLEYCVSLVEGFKHIQITDSKGQNACQSSTRSDAEVARAI